MGRNQKASSRKQTTEPLAQRSTNKKSGARPESPARCAAPQSERLSAVLSRPRSRRTSDTARPAISSATWQSRSRSARKGTSPPISSAHHPARKRPRGQPAPQPIPNGPPRCAPEIAPPRPSKADSPERGANCGTCPQRPHVRPARLVDNSNAPGELVRMVALRARASPLLACGRCWE